MKAYFVTNSGYDTIVIPETGQALAVDAITFAEFIREVSAADEEVLDFRDWVGEATDQAPQDFGTVLAVREDGDDDRHVSAYTDTAEDWTRRCAFWLRLG